MRIPLARPVKSGREFLIISGLPGSGKSSLAQQLAPALNLPILDKDAILERLFDLKGVGDVEWRRQLSRASDRILQDEAMASEGAILVSHWHLSGMSPDSGTPTEWLFKLSDKVVNVHCECPAEVAAERYFRRTRHPGHLDGRRSYAETLDSIRKVASLGRPDIPVSIAVDTSQSPTLEAVLHEVLRALSR